MRKSLSKSERLYKKKLFRFLKIRNRSKQKAMTAIIVKSGLYERGGFKQTYLAMTTIIPNLTAVFKKWAESLRTMATGLAHMGNLLKESEIPD